MQKLTAIIILIIMAGAAGAGADVTQHEGPYGLTALVVEHNGEKMIAWKVPSTDAKLLFIGSIFDGKEDLSWTYSRKLLGKEKLETEITAIETNKTDAGKLYIFFDPACSTCVMLFEKFKQQPPACTLVWVPLTISDDDQANQQGAQWLMNAAPEAGTCFSIAGDMAQYKQLTRNNYHLLQWLKGNDDPISVPTFVWSNSDKTLQIKKANELTNGRLDQVITELGKAKQ